MRNERFPKNTIMPTEYEQIKGLMKELDDEGLELLLAMVFEEYVERGYTRMNVLAGKIFFT